MTLLFCKLKSLSASTKKTLNLTLLSSTLSRQVTTSKTLIKSLAIGLWKLKRSIGIFFRMPWMVDIKPSVSLSASPCQTFAVFERIPVSNFCRKHWFVPLLKDCNCVTSWNLSVIIFPFGMCNIFCFVQIFSFSFFSLSHVQLRQLIWDRANIELLLTVKN